MIACKWVVDDISFCFIQIFFTLGEHCLHKYVFTINFRSKTVDDIAPTMHYIASVFFFVFS